MFPTNQEKENIEPKERHCMDMDKNIAKEKSIKKTH